MATPDPSKYYVLDFDTGGAVDRILKKADADYSRAEINTQLSTKQDTLNTNQLAAVNSGITSDKVNTINTTASNVSNLQTAVGNLDTEVSNLNTSVGNIETNVSNLETSVGDLETTVSDGGKDLKLTDYTIASEVTPISSENTINEAIGILEKAVQSSGNPVYSDTKAGWASKPALMSEAKALYIYTDYDTVDGVDIPAIKIGDGTTKVVNLPFTSANGITAEKISAWDKKVSAKMSETDPETLVLYY